MWIWFPLLAACTDAPVDTSAPACGETSPEMTTLSAEDRGMVDFGGVERPAVLLRAATADPDGDLSPFTLQIWVDDAVDGAVDTSDAPLMLEDTLSTELCAVFEASLNLVAAVDGRRIPYLSTVEFGAVAIDSAGHPSNGGEPVLTTWTTPDASGTFNR